MKGNFQTIVTAVFIFFIVAGVIVFAGFGGFGSKTQNTGPVTMTLWGTVPSGLIDALQKNINDTTTDANAKLAITYRELRPEELTTTLIEALASGTGPDAILLPQEYILRFRDKVFPLPYTSYPERQFKDTFIQEGELFMFPDGIYALPFSVDPMVMYWNRTLFTNAGITEPPHYWDEFYALAQRITDKDQSLNIKTSAVAFGEFENVQHAKEILAMLIMQAGNPIIANTVNGIAPTLLNNSQTTSPVESALRFYTEFSNPVKPEYSWNRALPDSRLGFLRGTVALYAGFASELFAIRQANPNLNFDVVTVPQVRGGNVRQTFGAMLGIAVMKSSKNTTNAFRGAYALTSAGAQTAWANVSGLPPVRRDLLSAQQTDAFRSVFYDSAVISAGFLDPDPVASRAIFKSMIEDVTSGRSRTSEAVSTANNALGVLLK